MINQKTLSEQYRELCCESGWPKCPVCGTVQIQFITCSRETAKLRCRSCKYETSESVIGCIYDEIVGEGKR